MVEFAGERGGDDGESGGYQGLMHGPFIGGEPRQIRPVDGEAGGQFRQEGFFELLDNAMEILLDAGNDQIDGVLLDDGGQMLGIVGRVGARGGLKSVAPMAADGIGVEVHADDVEVETRGSQRTDDAVADDGSDAGDQDGVAPRWGHGPLKHGMSRRTGIEGDPEEAGKRGPQKGGTPQKTNPRRHRIDLVSRILGYSEQGNPSHDQVVIGWRW